MRGIVTGVIDLYSIPLQKANIKKWGQAVKAWVDTSSYKSLVFVHPSLELVALLTRMQEGSVVYTDYTRKIKSKTTFYYKIILFKQLKEFMYILYSKSFEFYSMGTVKLNFSVNIKVVSYPCYNKNMYNISSSTITFH